MGPPFPTAGLIDMSCRMRVDCVTFREPQATPQSYSESKTRNDTKVSKSG
jgi:hypothetical protein